MFYKIENEFLSAEINSIGAELHSLKSKTDSTEYLWQGLTEIWYGQSPVLFPVIGQLLDGKYCYNGEEYEMPKHGFVRKNEFKVVTIDGSFAQFSIESNESFKKMYPFDFELLISFKLVNKSIKVIHTVINKTNGEMYFSIGAHPGFNCSIGDRLVFEDLETADTQRIDKESIIIDTSFPLLNNERSVRITEDIFEPDALILNKLNSSVVTLENSMGAYKIEFDFGNAPYLGIWAKPGAPYVCIEPWYGVNDSYDKKSDFSQKVGIQRLNKGENFRQIWTAKIID